MFETFALRHLRVWALFVLFFLIITTTALRAQCSLVCNGLMNVSLNETGQLTLTPDLLAPNVYNTNLCNPTGFSSYFEITAKTPNGQTIPTNPILTGSQVGQTLSVKLKHLPTGNICYSQVMVQDYLPPVFTCLDRVISCNTADLSPSNPLIGTPVVSDNCDPMVDLTFSDDFTDLQCNQTVNGNAYAGDMLRTWVAKDDRNNTAICLQHIFLQRKSIADIVFPINRDNVAAPALNCVNPTISPANTGLPQIDGLTVDGYCELSYGFTDNTFNTCGGSKKIIRTWTALDWCTNEIRTHNQIINIEDKTAPAFVCPANITISTASNACSAAVVLPSVVTTDNCSPTVAVRINTPFGNATTNGATFQNIAIGNYTATYTATDACNNSSTCSMNVKVEDLVAPTTLCKANLVVSLTTNGTANILAKIFDNNSLDYCCGVNTLTFEAKLANQSNFSPSIDLSCANKGQMIPIQMRVTDCNGNYNECSSSITVQDIHTPVLSCPAAVSVLCNQFSLANLNGYGTATATDNCDVPIVSALSTVANLNDCKVGTVLRSFRAVDMSGMSSTCTQTITVTAATPWNGSQNITWPLNYTTNQCATSVLDLQPVDLPILYQFPTINSNNTCSEPGVSYTDQVFQTAASGCFEIVRKWKVVDFCNYNANNPTGTGQWSHSQIIKVNDIAAPIFSSTPANLTIGLGDNCLANFTLAKPLVSDCSSNVTLTVSGDLGTSFGILQNIIAGVYQITFKAIDGCGNISQKNQTITVKDLQQPSPICQNGLTVNIMQNGQISVIARTFNVSSWDNCTTQGQLRYSFSTNVLDTVRAFDCDALGVNIVKIWVTDLAGNQNFSESYIAVQDNGNFCNPVTAVAGKIKTVNQRNVSDVTIRLSGTSAFPSVITDSSGVYVFPGLPVNIPYTITPEKNDNPLNGVTTYDLLLISKHILGLQPFDSPYKMIAADANKSGSVTTFDIVLLRKLVLGIIDTLPLTKSWRFIDAAHQFADPENPFSSPWLESKSFQAFQTSNGVADFVAVKVGDINLNASPSFGDLNTEVRNDTSQTLVFSVQDTQIRAGSQVRVPVQWSGDVQGYQFSLGFDVTGLRLDSVGDFELENLSNANFNLKNADKGWVNCNWENPMGEDFLVKNQVFSLYFTAKKNGLLSDFILPNIPTEAKKIQDFSYTIVPEAYRSGEKIEVSLVIGKIHESYTPQDSIEETKKIQEFFLQQSEPNPFENTTNITFNSSEEMDITFQIRDISGKLVFERFFEKIQGTKTISIEKNDLGSKGCYFYTISNGERVITKKMMLF
jgi:hypothetical protein